MVTKERIAAILARCEAATEGPWVVNMDADVEAVNVLRLITEDDPRNGLIAYKVAGFPYSAEGSRQRRDAEFISKARTDLPELAHEVLRLMDELESVQRLLLMNASESIQKLLDHHVELRFLTEAKLNDAQLEIGELREALTLAEAAAANWEECCLRGSDDP